MFPKCRSKASCLSRKRMEVIFMLWTERWSARSLHIRMIVFWVIWMHESMYILASSTCSKSSSMGLQTVAPMKSKMSSLSLYDMAFGRHSFCGIEELVLPATPRITYLSLTNRSSTRSHDSTLSCSQVVLIAAICTSSSSERWITVYREGGMHSNFYSMLRRSSLTTTPFCQVKACRGQVLRWWLVWWTTQVIITWEIQLLRSGRWRMSVWSFEGVWILGGGWKEF